MTERGNSLFPQSKAIQSWSQGPSHASAQIAAGKMTDDLKYAEENEARQLEVGKPPKGNHKFAKKTKLKN